MIKKMVFQAPSWRLEEVVVLAKLRAANILPARRPLYPWGLGVRRAAARASPT